MYYYGARYYDPRSSVWLGVDPMADKYPGWSPYAYCLDNPIRLIDPNGMEPGEPGGENPWVIQKQNEPQIKVPYLPGRQPDQSTSNQTGSSSTEGTLKNVGDGLSAAGIATAGTQVYTKVNAPSKITINTVSGATKNISKTNVLNGLKGTGNLLLGVSVAVDFSLSAMSEQSWGKTILNTGVGTLPLLIGTGPGLVIGAGYTVLDKFGTFYIPTKLSAYQTPLMPADATRVVLPKVTPIFH